LADAGLWRFIFFINVPFGLAALLILWLQVPESRETDSDKAIDIPGAVTIALGLALLTFGFLRVPAVGWDSIQVIGSLVAGGLFFFAFIVIQRKSKHPMMPLKLFSNPTFSAVNLLTFFLYAGLGSGLLFLSLNLVQVQGYSQLQSGLTFLPFTVLMVLIARFAGGLADKYGPRRLLIAGPAVAGAGFLILSFVKQTNGPADYWTTFFPGIIVFGLGMSLTVAPLTATVMGSVSNHFSGTASGINNALTRIANVFANAIFGALAVLFFSGALQTEISNLTLSTGEKRMVVAQAANLGNAKVPAIVSVAQKRAIEQLYHLGFIQAYQKILKISAALAFLGALMAVLFIKDSVVKKE
ncbi:MAG: MFS transporter, partial [Bacteroidota bacterium]|nr:MFS transporter [Bacteroidota bacterium]